MKTNKSLDISYLPSGVEAFLFDLDGVLLDTEGKYQEFWERIAVQYGLNPEVFPNAIKGQTTDNIVNEYFAPEVRGFIKERYQQYHLDMQYEFFDGALDVLNQCKSKGLKTAIVTSSDNDKMSVVYLQHPYLKAMVDLVLTAEDFNSPKPSPECWQIAAERLNVDIADCIIFEDSINGLKSAQASGGYVIGLTTTHPVDIVKLYCNQVITEISEIL